MKLNRYVLALILLALGCGDDGGSGGGGALPPNPPPPPPPPVILMSEDFGGTTWPPPNWIYSSGQIIPDSTTGTPSPCVRIQASATTGESFGGMGTAIKFPTPNLTASCDIRLGDSGFAIFALGTDLIQVQATVRIDPTFETYRIVPVHGTPGFQQVYFVAADGNFHTYKFTVDSSNNASWYRDGTLIMRVPGFSSVNMVIHLIASRSWFDTVRVTSP
jgi:hypothetical protein